MRIDIKRADEIIEQLKNIGRLHYVAHTTGATDVTADFNVESREELHNLLYEELGKIDGIRSTEASVMIQYVKDEYDWGTAYDLE
jgi:Lrp/AsnC family transcriptional regulator for asnA, asnC and gidA